MIETIPVGALPAGAAFDGITGNIYVADVNSSNVAVIDGSTNNVTQYVGVGQYSRPTNVLWNPLNGGIYVVNQGAPEDNFNITILNGSSSQVEGSVNMHASEPTGIAVDSFNGLLYVASSGSYDSGLIWVFNGTTNNQVNLDTNPALGEYSLATDSLTGRVYVANELSNNVTVFDGSTNSTIGSVNVTDRPSAVAFDSSNGFLYVAGAGNVSVINGTDDRVVVTIPTGTIGDAVAYDYLNGLVYVANYGSSNVTVINGSTNVVVGSITVGSDPAGIAIDSSNGLIYVTNEGSNSVSVISTGISTYPITFNESGLPSGYRWSVSMNGASNQSFASTIGFVEPNGTFNFSVGFISGYTVKPSTGTVTVRGQPVETMVTFSRTPNDLYEVMFNETGLSVGAGWTVVLGGMAQNSTNVSLEFHEPNGSYRYSISCGIGYLANPTSGWANVTGRALAVQITCQNETGLIPLTFLASNLPSLTNWTVTLTGRAAGLTIEGPTNETRTSNGGATIEFRVSSGQFNYAAMALGYQLISGSVTVSANIPQSIELAFTANAKTPGSNGQLTFPPVAVIGESLVFFIVGLAGIGGVFYRQRARSLQAGRALVSQIRAVDWEADSNGEPIPSTHR